MWQLCKYVHEPKELGKQESNSLTSPRELENTNIILNNNGININLRNMLMADNQSTINLFYNINLLRDKKYGK